jgi:predicted membrane chloride channel (bestrophin family)
MHVLRSARLIFTGNTIMVAILSCLATLACFYFELYADFSLALIGIAVVFPIVFSINGAYKRREVALNLYGTLKAHGRCTYFAVRDWTPNPDERRLKYLKHLLWDIMDSCGKMFSLDKRRSLMVEKHIYSKFSDLSIFIKESHERGMEDYSRANQYLSKMLDAFESMKHIYEYRTPITLRAYSKIFTYSLPIIYGPYFAHVARSYNPYLIFVMPVLFSFTLVSLDHIQDHLENPFDLVGEDDVIIQTEKFIGWLES